MFSAALLILGSAACDSVAPVVPRGPETVTLEPKSDATEAKSRCPEVSLAELEPPEPTQDPRRFRVAELMTRPDPAHVRHAPAIDVGTVRYATKLAPPRSKRAFHGGLGWAMPPTPWLTELLPSSDAELLSEWERLGEARMEGYGLALVLDEQIRVMRAAGDARPRDLHCAIAASAKATQQAKDDEKAREDETRRLIEVLERRPARGVGEDYVFGHLVAHSMFYEDPEEETKRAKARAAFGRVVEDSATPPELAARAEESLARLASEQPEQMKLHLERVLALTKDDERIIDARIKLLRFEDAPEAKERALSELVGLLEGHAKLRWRLARAAIQLSELQRARGAYEEARASAIRAAAATVPLRHGRADPWGAAPPLAESLVELDGAGLEDELPLSFMGPLGLAIIEAARVRGDRELAQQVAERLLRDLPQAFEAPRAASTRIALTEDPEARAAMQRQREQAYGEGSAFYQAQRARLSARFEGAALESELVELLESGPAWRGAPGDASALRDELEWRVESVVGACKRELAESGAVVTITVDTRDPQAKVRGGSPAARACLTRAVPSRFRSLPPRSVRVRLAPP